jgi:hypothetical protein
MRCTRTTRREHSVRQRIRLVRVEITNRADRRHIREVIRPVLVVERTKVPVREPGTLKATAAADAPKRDISPGAVVRNEPKIGDEIEAACLWGGLLICCSGSAGQSIRRNHAAMSATSCGHTEWGIG